MNNKFEIIIKEKFLNYLNEKYPETDNEIREEEKFLINLVYLEAIQKVIEMIENIKNPYPEDIFPKLELSEFQAQTINDFLVSNLRFPLDRLASELMRRARDNLKEELKSSIIGEDEKIKFYRCNDCGTDYDTKLEAEECCKIGSEEKK